MDAERIAKQIGDQVRDLLIDARREADEIVASAEADAHQIRLEAQEEVRQLRTEADADTQKRVDELRAGLDELQAKLRSEPGMVDVLAEVIPPQPMPDTAPSPSPVPAPPEPMPDPGPERVPEPEPPLIPEPTPPPDEGTPPEIDPGPASVNGGAAAKRRPDTAGARLVAMNMALNGSDPAAIREAVERDFEVPDAQVLVDEILDRAGVRS